MKDCLSVYLEGLPYYKKREDGTTTEHDDREVLLHNAILYVDEKPERVHKGDMDKKTLRTLCELVGEHQIFVFAEDNANKPPIDPPFDKGSFEKADIILSKGEIKAKLWLARLIQPQGKGFMFGVKVVSK